MLATRCYMPFYACVDNRDVLFVPPEYEIPRQSDLAINGHSYRRLDPEYLAWIESRIIPALNDRRIDETIKAGLITFHEQLKEAEPSMQPAVSVPANYQRPNIAEQTGWLMDLEWEETKLSK